MKTLPTIQKLSKVAKILCKIVFICCLVGGIGCLVGIISLALIPEGFEINGVTIHGIIEESAEVSMGTVYASMAVGMIMCAGEAVLSKIAEKYFKMELEAGDPFTIDGANYLMKLGVCTMCILVAADILASIVHGIMKMTMENVGKLDLSAINSGSIMLGVMFIIGALVCHWGAELKEEKLQNKKQTISDEKEDLK